MGDIIKDLKIPLKNYFYNENDGILRALSKVNIFIGANDNGKIQFLRSIFKENTEISLNIMNISIKT